MNEFTAKKLGEVYAFIKLVINTYAQGKVGFLEALPADAYEQEQHTLRKMLEHIENIANENDMTQITLSKADGTYEKIAGARDNYIAERWDDTVELYEWFSFNSGAGAAHAYEVYGAAIATNHANLEAIMKEAYDYFNDLLDTSKQYLFTIGQEKATAA